MAKLIEGGTWLMLYNKPAGNSSSCLQLPTTQPTLGNYRWDSLNKPISVIAYFYQGLF